MVFSIRPFKINPGYFKDNSFFLTLSNHEVRCFSNLLIIVFASLSGTIRIHYFDQFPSAAKAHSSFFNQLLGCPHTNHRPLSIG